MDREVNSGGKRHLSLVHGIPLREEPGLGAQTIPGYLREITERFADNEALVMYGADGVERWSYRDLWDRSVEVAQALIAAGVGKDSRVGILMANRPEFMSALFGTAMAGGVSVALSTFSTPAELDALLKASGVSILLFEDRVLKQDFSAILRELEPAVDTAVPGELESRQFPFLKRLVRLDSTTEGKRDNALNAAGFQQWDDFLGGGEGIPADIVEGRAQSVHPSDLGGIFFSSGTTSLPKGILHAQRAFAIQWWRWPRVMSIKEPARSWTGNGFFWSGNVTMVVGTALSTGGALILQPYFEAQTALKLIEAERVSFLGGRPHQWARLQAAPGWDAADLSSAHYITKGELVMEHPTVNTDWQLPMSYGTTETMTINCAYTADTPAEQYAGSFGEPLPGNILKIVDPLTRELVPRGERGEVCIKGPTLMLGYIGKTVEETLDEQGFYCTGDGGYVDEQGRLYWEGRLDDIIKSGGALVSPEEVDTAIAAYPGVKRTQTIGLPHDTLGEIVVACIVPVEGTTLEEHAITDFLRQRLASFKVPRTILFFREEDFALTGNEKVKTGELREAAARRLSTAD